MTNPYDPDPLQLPEPPYNPPDNYHAPAVSHGLSAWLIAGCIFTIAVAFVAAWLLLAQPARAAETEYDGSEPATSEGHALRDEPALLTAVHVSGTATWYCSTSSTCTRGYPASGMFAAAGSELRAWRGELVRVRSGSRSVVVRLVDSCQCNGRRIIDLYRSAFSRLASPSRGVIRVTVELERAVPLPPTSTR